jgi:hypothetical protein
MLCNYTFQIYLVELIARAVEVDIEILEREWRCMVDAQGIRTSC